MIKYIFLSFFNFKNLGFIFLIILVLTSILYWIDPITFLAYGLFSFIEVFSFFLVLIKTRSFNINKKIVYRNYKKIYFYQLCFSFLYLFFITLMTFLILQIYDWIFPGLSGNLFPNFFFNDNFYIKELNWSNVNFLVLFYSFIINYLLVFLIYLNFKNIKTNIFLMFFSLFIIFYLFYGGNFLNFKLNFNSLSDFGTKDFNNLNDSFLSIFKYLNPFFWNNMLISTSFINDGIFYNFNEFYINLNDIKSLMQIVMPYIWIIILSLLFLIKIPIKK